jgi:hypothetical protein
MTPLATEPRDHAVAMGAIAQFRILGGMYRSGFCHRQST